jgi:glycine/D-amino acid oxidase-like deaminating enzyme
MDRATVAFTAVMKPIQPESSEDVVVVGSGVVGAACAYFLARAGARVALCDRAFPGAGTSGACEGNVLTWDKELRRELPLGVRSAQLWSALADELPDDFEYDRKGSVVVAETEEEMIAARERAAILERHGVASQVLDAAGLRTQEPHAAPDLPGGVLFPADAQLEPRLATLALVQAAQREGARLLTGTGVRGIERDGTGRATAVDTESGRIATGAVVVAAGVWTPAVLATARLHVPVTPRKGHIVVLQRSSVRFRRKLSEFGYVSAVEADDAGLQVAMVVESTRSGTTLLGSSREHREFDRDAEVHVAAAIARRAARFFPVLRNMQVLRIYAGLRPLTPDHLPIVGPLAEADNICVATGHEGAGIGLAPATAELVTAWYTQDTPAVPLAWFSPNRFALAHQLAT